MIATPGKTTFTLAEAAKLLSCHRETLRRAIRSGELQAAKLGRGFRISRTDLESFWIASGGGDLFGSALEADPLENERTAEGEAVIKKKKSSKRTKSKQEQLSLLHSLEAEKGKIDE